MKNKIPKNFKNLKDEAKFWDSHDIGEFMGELRVVAGNYQPSNEKKTTLTIRITPSLKNQVETLAKNYDISTSSLIRMWMVNRIRTFAN
ncbi:BrnA antitoxin family protein [Patescibacteria group bacterium]|nr:BrnA antitoxin family protein [Patescibacteria group bacterium]MBU1885794.1 BrnA antitoxin family protein [Patescibacteria group bacterium]